MVTKALRGSFGLRSCQPRPEGRANPVSMTQKQMDFRALKKAGLAGCPPGQEEGRLAGSWALAGKGPGGV